MKVGYKGNETRIIFYRKKGVSAKLAWNSPIVYIKYNTTIIKIEYFISIIRPTYNIWPIYYNYGQVTIYLFLNNSYHLLILEIQHKLQ